LVLWPLFKIAWVVAMRTSGICPVRASAAAFEARVQVVHSADQRRAVAAELPRAADALPGDLHPEGGLELDRSVLVVLARRRGRASLRLAIQPGAHIGAPPAAKCAHPTSVPKSTRNTGCVIVTSVCWVCQVPSGASVRSMVDDRPARASNLRMGRVAAAAGGGRCHESHVPFLYGSMGQEGVDAVRRGGPVPCPA
jgi:hypothetical protein